MATVMDCADQLIPFLEAVVKGDWDEATKLRARIVELENEADDLKRDLRMHLPKSFFMPVARADLLDLLAVQDRVANKAKDITGLITGRQMQFPESTGTDLLRFAERSIETARQAQKTVDELDELYETSFGGAEAGIVQEMIKELDRLENETDRVEIDVRASLFKIERDLHPVDVMFMYKTIDWIGDLADWSQRVGTRLQLLMAR
jgi:predicted phosphate transport protein (TIGR00153 family)